MEPEQLKVLEEQEKQSMLNTLNDYFLGGSTGTLEQLRRAFHPDAIVRSVRQGELVQWTLEHYLTIVANAPLQRRRMEIIYCAREGNTAFAKLRLIYADFAFIDHFHLVKLGGKWLIIDKIFHREEFLPNPLP
jgi:hypothetical protein